MDYLDSLKADKKNKADYEESKEKQIEDLRKKTTGKHLPKLVSDKIERESSDLMVGDRKQIVDRVIDGLVKDGNNNPGYQSFKEELLAFLDEFPKE